MAELDKSGRRRQRFLTVSIPVVRATGRRRRGKFKAPEGSQGQTLLRGRAISPEFMPFGRQDTVEWSKNTGAHLFMPPSPPSAPDETGSTPSPVIEPAGLSFEDASLVLLTSNDEATLSPVQGDVTSVSSTLCPSALSEKGGDTDVQPSHAGLPLAKANGPSVPTTPTRGGSAVVRGRHKTVTASRPQRDGKYERSTCHQCRLVVTLPKMSCDSSIRPHCKMRFCRRCLVERGVYDNHPTLCPLRLAFQPDSTFPCPRCLGVCPCAPCRRQRAPTGLLASQDPQTSPFPSDQADSSSSPGPSRSMSTSVTWYRSGVRVQGPGERRAALGDSPCFVTEAGHTQSPLASRPVTPNFQLEDLAQLSTSVLEQCVAQSQLILTIRSGSAHYPSPPPSSSPSPGATVANGGAITFDNGTLPDGVRGDVWFGVEQADHSFEP